MLTQRKLKFFALTSATLMILSLAGCSSNDNSGQTNAKQRNVSAKVARTNSPLANLNYKPGKSAYTNVNHGKSTLNPKQWHYDHVIYTNLDKRNRTSQGNTGYLDKKNVANDSLRTRQIVKPTGYHQKFVNGEAIVNRGHEIAYSLSKGIGKNGKYNPKAESGDQNNPKNLFTQTAFSNQKVQTIYESKVRHALEHNEKVVYQVKPIFKKSNLMAKGVQMQAISTNRKLNFNVYLYNVQPGMKFNYANGRSTVDHQMKVPTPKGAPTFNDNKQQVENTAKHYGKYGYYRTRYYGRRAGRFAKNYAKYRLAHHYLRYHSYARRPYHYYQRYRYFKHQYHRYY